MVVITGFQGVDDAGNITTLGRGGSDTSAVAIAAAMKANECLIYTDVDGVYTTDPRVEPDARRRSTVSFEEMLEMASLGSKVLQIRSVEFAGKYKVPLRVLSSFTPWDIDINEEAKSGTLITFEEDENMEQAVVSGIAFNRDEAKISVLGVPDKPGIAYQHPRCGGRCQHRGRRDHPEPQQETARPTSASRCTATSTRDRRPAGRPRSCPAGRDRDRGRHQDLQGQRSWASACAATWACASKMFRVLSEEGINIQMISTSEIKTSVVIDEKYMELAVRALHKAFDLDQPAA